MDKIEEVKKLLWILDSKHNVSIPQTKENIDFIAGEIVKLFCQPAVVGQSEQLKCGNSNPPCSPNIKFGYLECTECNWSE